MLDVSSKEQTFLEMIIDVIDEREFHPFVYSHDKDFDNHDFLKSNQLFLELVYFLGTIGVSVDAEKMEYDDIVNRLLLSVTTMEANHEFWYFEIKSIDYSRFEVFGSKAVDYPFLRLFMAFRNGAALDKASICRILGKQLNSNDITQLKKTFNTEHAMRQPQ